MRNPRIKPTGWSSLCRTPGMLLILIFTCSACGGDNQPSETRQEKPVLKAEAPQTESPGSSPAQPGIPQVTRETRETYQWYCAQCHGIEGKGNGINASHVAVPPRDHTKAEYLETRSDRQLFEAIKLGGLAVGRAPCMPAWGHTLDEETIHSLVRYIRELCSCEAL